MEVELEWVSGIGIERWNWNGDVELEWKIDLQLESLIVLDNWNLKWKNVCILESGIRKWNCKWSGVGWSR